MKNTKIFTNNISLLVISIILQSFSFLSIKFSTLQEGFYILVLLILAFVFLGARAIVWQILLKSIELSTIYPYASLVQVLILIYAVIFFHESVTVYNIIGLVIMLGGIYYMSRKV